MSIDTDPQQQEAASPRMLVVRSSSRYTAWWRATSRLFAAFAIAAIAAGCAAPHKDLEDDEFHARLRAMEAEQQMLLVRLKQQLRELDNLPPPTVGEPKEVTSRRERLSELKARLGEIEARIEQQNAARTLYVGDITGDSVVDAYYTSVFEGIVSAPRVANVWSSEMPQKGRAVVVVTVRSDGQLEKVEFEEASSALVTNYLEKVVRSAAPFRPFDAVLAQKANRLVLVRAIAYER